VEQAPEEAIGTFRTTVYDEHLYIGGGNAKAIRFAAAPK
jgi:hypothetical protein